MYQNGVVQPWFGQLLALLSVPLLVQQRLVCCEKEVAVHTTHRSREGFLTNKCSRLYGNVAVPLICNVLLYTPIHHSSSSLAKGIHALDPCILMISLTSLVDTKGEIVRMPAQQF